jgi:hypothetical protein
VLGTGSGGGSIHTDGHGAGFHGLINGNGQSDGRCDGWCIGCCIEWGGERWCSGVPWVWEAGVEWVGDGRAVAWRDDAAVETVITFGLS